MPIYELKCKNCGNIFEYLCFKSSDRDQALCPKCGHKKSDLLMSAFSSTSSSSTGKGANSASLSSCSPSGGFS